MISTPFVVPSSEREESFAHILQLDPASASTLIGSGGSLSFLGCIKDGECGPEWLLHIVCNLLETERVMLLLMQWRIWHVHNEITHGNLAPPIKISTGFLRR